MDIQSISYMLPNEFRPCLTKHQGAKAFLSLGTQQVGACQSTFVVMPDGYHGFVGSVSLEHRP